MMNLKEPGEAGLSDAVWRFRLWVALAAIFFLVRLVMVSHHETLTSPWDSSGYMEFAARWYWGAEYGQYAYTRVPTFPLAISLCTMLGLPLRLVNELVLLAAALWAAKATRVCGLSRVSSLLVYASVLFEPWTVRIFDYVVPDGMYACFLIMAVSQSVLTFRALVQRSRVWTKSIMLGILAAITGTLRQEWPVVFVPMCVACAGAFSVVFIEARREKVPVKRAIVSRSAIVTAAALLVVPFVVLWALNSAYSAANARVIGLAQPTDFLAPGYSKLHKALLSIPPAEGTGNPKIQAPTDARMKAYAVSPTLRTLQPFIEGDALQQYARATRDISPNQPEFGAWLVFGIRHGAFKYRKWTDAKELDEFFATAAKEIVAAQERGELAKRWTPFTFVAPEWNGLAKQLPKSAIISWNLMRRDWDALKFDTLNKVPAFHTALYDHVSLRRGGLGRLQSDTTKPDDEAVAWTLWHHKGVREATDGFWDRCYNTRGKLLVVLCWLPLAAIGVLLYRAKRTSCISLALVFTLAIFATFAARFAFVALLDASGVWAQPRYLLAAVMLLRLGIVLALLMVAEEVIRWIASRRKQTVSR